MAGAFVLIAYGSTLNSTCFLFFLFLLLFLFFLVDVGGFFVGAAALSGLPVLASGFSAASTAGCGFLPSSGGDATGFGSLVTTSGFFPVVG